jgi:hypothetical protein
MASPPEIKGHKWMPSRPRLFNMTLICSSSAPTDLEVSRERDFAGSPGNGCTTPSYR